MSHPEAPTQRDLTMAARWVATLREVIALQSAAALSLLAAHHLQAPIR